MRKQILLFILFSSISFSQVNDIIDIFNIRLGLPIKNVMEKWDCENFNEFAKLIHQTDDILKYEGIKDSFFLGAIFYFVDDSLYMFVVSTKQNFSQINQLSFSVNKNFGIADSVLYQKMGKEGESSFQNYQTSYWSIRNFENNSFDIISTSQEMIERKLNLFSFSKFNYALTTKAKLLNKHQLKL